MLSLIERYGYLIVFLGVMLEGVGIPLPGETVLIAAGVLAHRGSLTLWGTMAMGGLGAVVGGQLGDRKSTRLNSSHANISYAVFCLKKKKYQQMIWIDHITE